MGLRTIHYIEDLDDGHHATLDGIHKIAKAFGVGFHDLLRDVDLTEN